MVEDLGVGVGEGVGVGVVETQRRSREWEDLGGSRVEDIFSRRERFALLCFAPVPSSPQARANLSGRAQLAR